MNAISKADLQFVYSWTAIPPDDPRSTGQPDSTLLNRNEGYEVLPFINRFCRNHNVSGQQLGRAEALKVERMIKQHLPGTLRSHANVITWIESNWSAYK